MIFLEYTLDGLIIIQYNSYYRTVKMEEKTTNIKNDIELLRENYLEMDETGKEKLKEVSEKLLEIYNTVNDGGIENED